jgi:hypothetical protein
MLSTLFRSMEFGPVVGTVLGVFVAALRCDGAVGKGGKRKVALFRPEVRFADIALVRCGYPKFRFAFTLRCL